MIKAANVVKEEDVAVTGRHSCNYAFNGQTVDHASLCQVAGTETATHTLVRCAFHHVIE